MSPHPHVKKMFLNRLIILCLWGVIIPGLSFASVNLQPSAFAVLDAYLQEALDETARKDFSKVSQSVKHNIFWQQKGGNNKYQSAFRRSYPFFSKLLRDDVPNFVFLIPYLESGWQPTKGKPASDYGYWQMVSEVVAEIQQLDEASDALRKTHPDKVRSDPELSTEAALIHIKRYYFYFRHVARFSEADAWLFSVTAFNWGAGNVKAMLKEISAKKSVPVNFATFYHYLYKASQRHPEDKSMRVALEYLPNLLNMAELLEPLQAVKAHSAADSVKKALTLNKSSSVSTP